MRSIWKGHIRFSLVTIPIQVYNALETDGDLSFKQLHNKDNGKINYKKVCSSCNEEVPFGDIVKGFEYEADHFVVLDKEELEKVKLKSNRAIDIEAFVDISEVHPSRFEAVYYIGPNGAIATPTYNLLTKALLRSGKAGVGRIVLREREDVVLLMPEEKGLIMYKLRYPYEVREISDVPDMKDEKVDAAQLELADTLIKSMLKSFDEVKFVDGYRDEVMKIVNQKISGKEIVTISEQEEETPVVDIMSALKKSIEDAKRKSA